MTTKTPVKDESTTAAAAGPYTYACGKRKTAVARVRLFRGTGRFTINDREFKNYFPVENQIATILAAFKVAEVNKKDYDLIVQVSGGGVNAQSEAVRHGVAIALQKENETRRVPLKQAGFLRSDARVKERKKPGLRRARRAPQWAKR